MKNKISTLATSLILGALLVVPASAQTTTAQTKLQARQATKLTNIISRSDKAIEARITSLNNLSTKIQSLKNVSDAEKVTLSSEIQTNLGDMNSLKTKIDADTDVATATNDDKSITKDYRVYALVLPQTNIAAAADRVTTITGMLTTISGKLQSRITADQTAGKDVTSLQSALTDLNAKVADANSQAATAQSGIASLVPDNGNQTTMQANTTALKAARANIKTATADLQAARKDANTITKGLKTLGGNSMGTASSTAQ